MNDRRVGTPPVNTSLLSPLLKHLFVGDVPLLYPVKNVGKQMEIELWLGTVHIDTELLVVTKITEGIQHVRINPTIREMGYVI